MQLSLQKSQSLKKNSAFDEKTTLTQMMTLNIQPTETQTLLKVGVEGWKLGDGDRGWGMVDGG